MTSFEVVTSQASTVAVVLVQNSTNSSMLTAVVSVQGTYWAARRQVVITVHGFHELAPPEPVIVPPPVLSGATATVAVNYSVGELRCCCRGCSSDGSDNCQEGCMVPLTPAAWKAPDWGYYVLDMWLEFNTTGVAATTPAAVHSSPTRSLATVFVTDPIDLPAPLVSAEHQATDATHVLNTFGITVEVSEYSDNAMYRLECRLTILESPANASPIVGEWEPCGASSGLWALGWLDHGSYRMHARQVVGTGAATVESPYAVYTWTIAPPPDSARLMSIAKIQLVQGCVVCRAPCVSDLYPVSRVGRLMQCLRGVACVCVLCVWLWLCVRLQIRVTADTVCAT